MLLVRPAHEHLASVAAALRNGWSPNTTRPEAAQEELALIEADADDYLRWMDDPEARGPLVTLADGRQVPRIPGLRRWLWAEDSDAPASELQRFIGVISLRWMPGHAPLPPHVLGHVGYAIVPWHAGRGHATAGLKALLPLARAQGLTSIELTTDPDNLASQRVITRNGGVLVEHFDKGPTYGHQPGLRYRITL
jgi:predicted acetyltransferase